MRAKYRSSRVVKSVLLAVALSFYPVTHLWLAAGADHQAHSAEVSHPTHAEPTHTGVEIIDFWATLLDEASDLWSFEGRVTDLAPGDTAATVTFGGLLAGSSTEPGDDGFFYHTEVVPGNGEVTAVATCAHGWESGTATTYVYNSY